jgi:hypothetical protein
LVFRVTFSEPSTDSPVSGRAQTIVELINLWEKATDIPRTSRGPGGTRKKTLTWRSVEMTARLYRLALVAGVVAVFLEGLGAGLKWG